MTFFTDNNYNYLIINLIKLSTVLPFLKLWLLVTIIMTEETVATGLQTVSNCSFFERCTYIRCQNYTSTWPKFDDGTVYFVKTPTNTTEVHSSLFSTTLYHIFYHFLPNFWSHLYNSTPAFFSLISTKLLHYSTSSFFFTQL